jgi:uncharacterized membrane protein YqgA involved in biofilm formation
MKLVTKVLRNLALYFGLYFLSIELDKWMKLTAFDKLNMLPAILGINAAFLVQIFLNYKKRQEVAARLKAKKKEDGDTEAGYAQSIMGSTGLSTIFNALTQTTTTLCANGQCFTIYSNTIASNLAAFGVSVSSINTYLIPLCFLLLSYSIWSVYKQKRSCTNRPFLLSLTGGMLIVFDNFLFGEALNLHSIPSYVGNGMLIAGAIWASRDQSKEQTPFGF